MISTSAARTTELATQTDNPFAAYNNLAATATLGGTATLTDGAAANAVTGTTYDYWLPNITGTTAQFTVKIPVALTMNCIGIAAHNLFTLGGTVVLQRSTDGGTTWSSASVVVTPTDNSPIVFRIASSGLNAADWRLNFAGLTAAAPLFVGVMFFGYDMVFPRRFYKDFAPIISPTEVQLQSNVSAGGNLLGNSIIAKGSTLAAAFRNMPDTFCRGALLPLIPHFNAGKPFFFGWRPATYPQDIHYCWREGDVIRPVNSGPLALMSFDMAMRAFEP